jgi:hypothetical protein
MHPSDSGLLHPLLLCARRQIRGDRSTEIANTIRSGIDWEAILDAAAEHSLTAILCKNIEESAGGLLPLNLRERLSQEFRACACRNLRLTAELFHVLNELERNHVCAVPHKGPVLAALAYGDVALRGFSDLDFLLPQQQIAAAHQVLIGLGFEPELRDLETPNSYRRIPGQYVYRSTAGTMVELHTELTLRYFPKTLEIDDLCERRQPVDVAGQQVLTFSPEDTLLLLVVHGSKHVWERLGWIADIAALLERQPVDWEVIFQRAQLWGISRMALIGAGLCKELFDTNLPMVVQERLRSDRAACRLIEEILRWLVSAEERRPGVFGRFAFRVRVRGRLRDGIPYAMRMAFKPTESDRDLGSRFGFLHSILRPLRLAKTYGWRTRIRPKRATNTNPKFCGGHPRN